MRADDALLTAVAAGDLAGARAALAAGADPDATRVYSMAGERERIEGAEPALLLATRGGHGDLVALLLEHRAAVDARDPATGRTALFVAAAQGDSAIVAALVAAGASPALGDGRAGLDAFAAAIAAGHVDVIRQFVAAGAKATARALEEACRLGRVDLAELCRDAGLAPRAARVLEATARAGQIAMVEWLLTQDIDLRLEGPAALCEAANAGRTDVVVALARRGVPLDWRNAFGWTPLHLAAYNADAATVQALLAAGADPTASDRAGNRPAHWAREAGKTANVALLERATMERG